MELAGEAVRLVARTLEQLQRRRVVPEHDRLAAARQEDLLDPLGQADDGHAEVAERLERAQAGRQLSPASVDHDQARQRRERGVVVLLVRRALALGHVLGHPPGQDLVHRGEVILHCLPDAKTAVVGLLRGRALEHDHRRDRVLGTEVRDVEALDPHRDRLHAEDALERLE